MFALVASSGEFEAVVSFGVGLMKRTSILRTMRLRRPSRYVIDVRTNFERTRVKTWFFDEDRFVANTTPFFRAVRRSVPVPAAGEIMPTLRQFPSVPWVKIYDPQGTTGTPTGRSDSIPARASSRDLSAVAQGWAQTQSPWSRISHDRLRTSRGPVAGCAPPATG